MQAISGYQLSNENYPVVVDVLKCRFGNKQLIVDSHQDEDWTVPKLCQLLGKHISALEMAAGTEFPQTSTHSDHNMQVGQSESHKRTQQVRPTASGLLTDQNKGIATQRPIQVKCVYCSQLHWSDQCSK